MIHQDTSIHTQDSDLSIRLELWEPEDCRPYYSLTLREAGRGYGGVTVYLSPEQVGQIRDALSNEATLKETA